MATGIIAEYNPFHNGHLYHINKTKELTSEPIIAVISGNFVQRGETALLDKSKRVYSALKGGCNLVLELPIPWSLSSAEGFAFGGVSILNNTGVVNKLSFGSETGNTDLIMRTAQILLDVKTDSLIVKELEKGISYPKARENAVKNLYGYVQSDVLSSPNDILGVEYCKAILKLNTKITPFAVERKGVGHNDNSCCGNYMSASTIRQRVYENKKFIEYVPSFAMFDADDVYSFKKLEAPILATLRKMSVEDLKLIPQVSEGLEYRIFEKIKSSLSFEQLYGDIKTKRYTLSRIRRIVLSSFLGIKKDYSKLIPPYIRVLGFDKQGKTLLKEMKDKASLPVIMKYADIKGLDDYAQEIFNLECISTDLFNLAGARVISCGEEQKRKIIII